MALASSLDDFQRDFAAALLGDASSPAAAALLAQPGFAVHRNTLLRGCIDALAGNYPTVRALVGGEWFDAAAGSYARIELPRDGRLAAYGEGFAAFLDDFTPAVDLPYLGGVARLDRAWTEAHLAADAPTLATAALATLAPQQLLDVVLVPHPAARWVRSPTLPVFSIWRRHREHAALDGALAGPGDGGLLTRPGPVVAWRALDAVAATFLDGCASGLPFGVAAERAGTAVTNGSAGIAAALPVLVAAGAFTRLERVRP